MASSIVDASPRLARVAGGRGRARPRFSQAPEGHGATLPITPRHQLYSHSASIRAPLLAQLFAFADAPFDSRSLSHPPRHEGRKKRPLADSETARVTELALPAYEHARALETLRPLHG